MKNNKKFCISCGKQLLPIPPNLTGYKKNTGAPVYALWLYCQNDKCESVVHGVPQKELVSDHATKEQAEKWCPIVEKKKGFFSWLS